MRLAYKIEATPRGRIMVAYVYVVFRKEDAEPRLDALTKEASRQAKECGLNLHEQWWNPRPLGRPASPNPVPQNCPHGRLFSGQLAAVGRMMRNDARGIAPQRASIRLHFASDASRGAETGLANAPIPADYLRPA